MQLPPSSYFALLKAEAGDYRPVQLFLKQAAELARATSSEVTIYDPIRPQIERLKNMERGQLLLQAGSRKALQQLLRVWMPQLRALKIKNKLRWMLDIDPLEF